MLCCSNCARWRKISKESGICTHNNSVTYFARYCEWYVFNMALLKNNEGAKT
jgi:hypothetical protein